MKIFWLQSRETLLRQSPEQWDSDHGHVRMPGSGGVVSTAAQLLPRCQHCQHDQRLERREGLLCPHPQPPTRPHTLGHCQLQRTKVSSSFRDLNCCNFDVLNYGLTPFSKFHAVGRAIKHKVSPLYFCEIIFTTCSSLSEQIETLTIKLIFPSSTSSFMSLSMEYLHRIPTWKHYYPTKNILKHIFNHKNICLSFDIPRTEAKHSTNKETNCCKKD